MARSREEQELSEHFADEYRRAQTPIMLDLERAVCGCDYGGTSWTTREEAEQMGWLLELGEGKRLLEIGAGCGWPALFLAGETGCDATLADLPFEALRIAAEWQGSRSLEMFRSPLRMAPPCRSRPVCSMPSAIRTCSVASRRNATY
jgi:hypothetical protein